MQKVIPAPRVRSYDVSRSFYGKLGFGEKWKHQFEQGLAVFASIARDDMELFLTEHAGDCQFGGLVLFYVPDVDLCHRQFREQGVSIARPPDNSLGSDIREMLIVDPDGNLLSFITRSAVPGARENAGWMLVVGRVSRADHIAVLESDCFT